MPIKFLLTLLAIALLSDSVLIMGQVTFRQLYLAGNVVLEDGSPPPERVRIELVCNSQIQPQAYTLEDGSFNFAVGGTQAERVHAGSADRGMASPSVGSVGEDRSHVSMSNCEVRAALAGYRSSTIKLGRRSVFEDPNIGTIVLSAAGEQPKRNPLVSLSTLKAPEKARESYVKGEQELLKEDPDAKKAGRELEKAVKEYPEFGAAWNLLGEARLLMEETEGAAEAFRKAIEVDPGYVTPCVTLSLLNLKRGNVEEAAAISEKAITLAPDLADARYYHGLASAQLGCLNKAETSLKMVLHSPEANRFPRTDYILGMIAAQSGDLESAVTHYRRYLALEPDSKAAEAVREQIDQWKANRLIR